jgi:Ras-related protein Rab-5C
LILVYSVAQANSLALLDECLAEAKKYRVGNPVVALCGSQTDLAKRAVSVDAGRRWAEAEGALYFETSSLNGDGVDDAFEKMMTAVLEKE